MDEGESKGRKWGEGAQQLERRGRKRYSVIKKGGEMRDDEFGYKCRVKKKVTQHLGIKCAGVRPVHTFGFMEKNYVQLAETTATTQHLLWV